MRPRHLTFCQSSPSIFTFSSNYMNVMFTYLVVLLWYPSTENRSHKSFLWRIPRCHTNFLGLTETAGSNPAVQWKQWDPIPQSHWNRGIRSQGLIETVGSDPAVSMTPLDLLQWRLQIRWIFYKNFHVGSSSLIQTAESKLCKWLSRISQRIRSHMQNGM
jgi:hypothetical protein